MMRLRIEIHLKRGVADPEGDNTLKALRLLGFRDVKSVRSAKLFVLELNHKDEKQAKKSAEEMCRKLLANPVIHDYRIETVP